MRAVRNMLGAIIRGLGFRTAPVPTFNDETLTLVKKKTTREIARTSFKIQLLVASHRMTIANERGPRAQPIQQWLALKL
jgi:hypothetical protein